MEVEIRASKIIKKYFDAQININKLEVEVDVKVMHPLWGCQWFVYIDQYMWHCDGCDIGIDSTQKSNP
jgi:hypothetical protein